MLLFLHFVAKAVTQTEGLPLQTDIWRYQGKMEANGNFEEGEAGNNAEAFEELFLVLSKKEKALYPDRSVYAAWSNTADLEPYYYHTKEIKTDQYHF